MRVGSLTRMVYSLGRYTLAGRLELIHALMDDACSWARGPGNSMPTNDHRYDYSARSSSKCAWL
jgi:hypothetical protein